MLKSGRVVCGLAAWLLLGGCKGTADDIGAPPPPIPVATAPTAPNTPSAVAAAEIAPAIQPSSVSIVRPAAAAPAPSGAAAVPASAASAAGSASKPANHAADASEVKSCCGALRKEATGPNQATYESAAKTCDVIADLVAKGKTTHEAALTSLRAALRGGKLPAGCH